MRRTAMLLAAVLVPALLAGCTQEAANEPGPTDRGLGVGEMAPDFSLPSSQGGTVSLSGFEGRPLLLYFSMGPG